MLEDASKKAPQDQAIEYHLGVAYEKLNESGRAKLLLQHALELNPESWPFWLARPWQENRKNNTFRRHVISVFAKSFPSALVFRFSQVVSKGTARRS
jgi:tetratricopeptide (TPR) repeat protein